MPQAYQGIFASASDFRDMLVRRAATLLLMGEQDSTKAAISARIKELMKAQELVHQDGRLDVSGLHERILDLLKQRQDGKKKTITRQTVSNWVGGQSPKLDELPYLARALDTEREYILFGSKRGEQIKNERQFLSRVTEEENRLLTAYREANKQGQKTILKLAKDVAEDHPAIEATIHPMRRKDDKINTR